MSEHHDLKVLLSMRGGYQEQAAKVIADLQTENDQLRADKAELVEALEAAMDFIDKHPADPDISGEQTRAWMRLQEINAHTVLNKHKESSNET